MWFSAVKHLPIAQVVEAIQAELSEADDLVLEAPPGAGKTTVVPLVLLMQEQSDSSWLAGQKIVVLEPRRLAARAAAERMAELLGESAGETVGYRMRFDTRVSQKTRIEVVTEGVFTRMLQDDPSLDGIGLVIFDEFHERSLDADLGLALTLNGRQLFGDLREQPLKLLVMSATLDGNRISELLDGAPVVRSEGKMYPVDLHYGSPYQYGEDIAERVASTIDQALADQGGSILAFLPGQAEIRRTEQALRSRGLSGDNTIIVPLYGDLNLTQQRQAVAPAPKGQRKVVLATNIAETSLTIEGVRVVVDSGLCREPEFDPRTGMTRLATKRIAKSSAIQRAGRAGRLEAGACYRLWSESQQDELAQYPKPEVLQSDLMPLALQLLQWGIGSPDELQWLDKPQRAPWNQALELLEQLGACELSLQGERQQWLISGHGEAMAKLPVHPRLAHMLIKGTQWGCADLAADIAALLGERDLSPNQGVEFNARLAILQGRAAAPQQVKGLLNRIKQQRKQLSKVLARISVAQSNRHTAQSFASLEQSDQVGLLLSCAYPDRLAKPSSDKADNQQFQLSNGRKARLMTGAGGLASTWLVIANIAGVKGEAMDRIYQAATVNPRLLKEFLPELIDHQQQMEWSETSGRFEALDREMLGAIVLAEQAIANPDSEVKGKALVAFVRKEGLGVFDLNDDFAQWRARIELLRQLPSGHSTESNSTESISTEGTSTESRWPDLRDANLLATLEQWLLPYLDPVTKLADFKKLNLKQLLQSLLPWPLPAELEEQAPERIQVPSGNRHAIDYCQTPPVLAVKLQEMFGSTDTPKIAQGKQPLMLHLLSPAGRPLQVTQDLLGFWTGSYEQVKKEMKGRYPKHPWPDDPMAAVATAKTKRHLQ